jgi:hypothetical protein
VIITQTTLISRLPTHMVASPWRTNPLTVSRGREVFTIAFEECNSLKTAEAAARRLLVENAEHFSKCTGIEPRVYTELEWSPRTSSKTADEGPFF